jgi:hypothetical protein
MIDRSIALQGAEIARRRDASPAPVQTAENPDVLLVNHGHFLGAIRGLSLLASVETPWVIGKTLEAANQLDPATVQRMHEMGTGMNYVTAALVTYFIVNFVGMGIRAKYPKPA